MNDREEWGEFLKKSGMKVSTWNQFGVKQQK